VVQRGDIDHWYGSIAEAEFGTFLDAREAGLHGVVTDEQLRRQVKPKIFVEGEECQFYPYQEGKSPPSHTHVELAMDGSDEVVRLVFKKHPSEMAEDAGKQWRMVVERDWTMRAPPTLRKRPCS
jgi:hypothetical protein